MKFLLPAIFLMVCLAAAASAQQDPDDPGNPDSILVSFIHLPDVAAGDSSVVFEVEFVVDELVRTASAGYAWNHAGWVMDSAVWTTAAEAAFEVTTLAWAKDDVDSSNFYRRFQTTVFGTVGISSPTAVVHYFGRVTSFAEGDTLRVSPDSFVDMLLVDTLFNEITPLWGGDAVFGYTADVETIAAGSLPATYRLAQNYPNPFNPATRIQFDLPRQSRVRLTVVNTLGQTVATLVDRQLPPDRYYVDWDGRADDGRRVASGVYFYRLSADEFVATRKMLLLK